LKPLLLSSSCLIGILIQCNFVIAEESAGRIQIDALTQQGQQLLDRGHPSEAIQTWQKALDGYRSIRYQQGVNGTLLNQSIAYMRLGQYSNACTNLAIALDLEDKVCQTRMGTGSLLQITQSKFAKTILKNSDKTFVPAGFQNLGHTLRALGKLDDSATALNRALQAALQLNQPTAPILLSIANTDRAFFSKAHNIALGGGDQLSRFHALSEGKAAASKAFQSYDTLARSSEPNSSLSAKLNWLSLYAELIEWLHAENEALVPVLANLAKTVTSQAVTYIQELLRADFNKTAPIDSVFNRLRFSRTILSLAESQSALINNDLLLAAFNQAQAALDTSRSIGNRRAESEALGMMGKLYEHNKQTAQAQSAYEQANGLATSPQASDLSYQWQWALGRLSRDSGQSTKAIEYYKGATKNLEQVRSDLLFVNSELEYTFRKAVEPVYKQYIALLLTQTSPNLQDVVAAQDKLQTTEVENYLQCGQLNLTPLSQVISKLDPHNRPTVFYILDLGDRYGVIVTDPNGQLHYYSPNHQRVLEASSKLSVALEDRRFETMEPENFLPYATVLYDELIAPAERAGYIPDRGTLVFAEDAFIQNIPISMLYDGQKYLIEKHSLSMALGSGLRFPEQLSKSKSEAVFAGLSQKSPSFSLPQAPKGLEPIQDVEIEANEISGLLKTNELLNKNFTWEHLQESLSPNVKILQISTHGQFSSNPDKTVLFGWDKTINSLQIRDLLRGKTDKPELELLFLSACETAKGDKRSTLGIAGIAAQAGARSTVATLWKIKSKSTPDFVKNFYQTLLDPNQIATKAVALQKAQLALLQSDDYNHPYYWASFILVGSWL
jgi:CHAT domain-containing protein